MASRTLFFETLPGLTCTNPPAGPGVLIAGIEEDSPAQGILNVGDIILSVNGIICDSHERCTDALKTEKEGLALVIGTLSTRKTLKKNAHKKMRLIEAKEGPGLMVDEFPIEAAPAQDQLLCGDTVLAINGRVTTSPREAYETLESAIECQGEVTVVTRGKNLPLLLERTADQHFGFRVKNTPNGIGVMCCGLDDDGVALQAGLKVGDVILAVDGRSVNQHAHAMAMVRTKCNVSLVVASRDQDYISTMIASGA